MSESKVKIRVRFLIEKEGEDVFAYFPNERFDRAGINRSCYAHIGQHSACAPEYAEACKEAGPEQFEDLKQELESIGYELEIIN